MLPPATLHLFDSPYLTVGGRRREIPEGGKRLLVLVALGRARMERRAVAGTLWPVGGDARAAGNLRSALWRLRGAGVDLLDADQHAMRLTPGTTVDLDTSWERATRLIRGAPLDGDLDPDWWAWSTRPLLPGWCEEWVVFERERWRHRRLHGMEELARHLTRSGRRAYRRYSRRLVAELGVSPSAALTSLVARRPPIPSAPADARGHISVACLGRTASVSGTSVPPSS